MRLYVHVPFCESKCTYCSFYSVPTANRVEQYLSSLATEFQIRAGDFSSFASIYIGGGTPSALHPAQLDCLLKTVGRIAPGGEFTVEMNPESVDAEKLSILKTYGVNRISLGFQSTNDRILTQIGRRHDFHGGINALELVKAVGFPNYSLDFITGFAGQTPADVATFLSLIQTYDVPHVSAYALIFDGPKMDDDEERALFHQLREGLEVLGLHRYEISSFGKPGFEGRHNTAYWEREEYIGLGPSAASFVGSRRIENIRSLDTYCRHYVQNQTRMISEFESQEILDTEDVVLEALLLGLRMTKGISIMDFEKNYGVKLLQNRAIPRLIEEGLLHQKGDRIAFTTKGFDLSNAAYVDIMNNM